MIKEEDAGGVVAQGGIPAISTNSIDQYTPPFSNERLERIFPSQLNHKLPAINDNFMGLKNNVFSPFAFLRNNYETEIADHLDSMISLGALMTDQEKQEVLTRTTEGSKQKKILELIFQHD